MTAAKNRMSAEERKAQILDAALKVFSQKGFRGARTKEIAREAGISETLMFRHFRNKENLYKHALEHLFSHHPVFDELEGAMAACDDRQVLLVLAEHIMRHSRQDERIVRVSLFSGLEGLGMAEHEDAAMKVLIDYLGRRMEDGALKKMDPGLAARFFLYAVFLYVADIHLKLIGPLPSTDDHEVAEGLVDVFLEGMLPR